MRRDMKRVLIGRPRWKSSGKNYRRRKLEDLIADWSPERLGMRRGHRDRKLVTDHLGPLRRFLRGWKNVG